MSLLTTADQRRRTTLRRLLLAVGALMLVVAGTVTVTLLVVDGGQPESAPTPSTGQASTASRAAPDPGAGIWTMPPVSAGPLVLPQP
ncbi:MAG: hypothetical protein ACRDUV_18450, partial [Pseudonocardiaceae bacterium]